MTLPFKKILVINPFGIGDVLFTTPLLRNIKTNVPDAFIGFLANRRTAPFLQEQPLVDAVYVYERDEFHALYQKSRILFLKEWSVLLQSIRQERYDVVVDLSLSGAMSFFSRLIGIPRRVGFHYKNRSWFLTDKIPLAGYEGRHVVEYYLDLLDVLGMKVFSRQMELTIPLKARQWAEEFLSAQRAGERLPIVMAPGGGASWGKDAVYKRWPAAQYVQLADKTIENRKSVIILVGNEKEKTLCAQIEQGVKNKSRVVSLCGATDILQSAALFSQCALAVVNDGGPLHIAVASGAKTVSIFGPVDENVYGPYPREGHRVVTSSVPCRPCYRRFRRAECEHIRCIQQITVEDVWKQVEELLPSTERDNSHERSIH